jgi:hypothetical protein
MGPLKLDAKNGCETGRRQEGCGQIAFQPLIFVLIIPAQKRRRVVNKSATIFRLFRLYREQ